MVGAAYLAGRDFTRDFALRVILKFVIMKSLCWRPLGQGWSTRGSTLWLNVTELFNPNSETHEDNKEGDLRKSMMFLISSCNCLCLIHWSQVLSREWRCSWNRADRRCPNYIWVINNFIAHRGASYIRGFTAIILNTCNREDVVFPAKFKWVAVID